MQRTTKVKKTHNCLIISLAGDQQFVKIFDDSGTLIRHSQTPGATELRQMVVPGKYKVETDGTIETVDSINVEPPTV